MANVLATVRASCNAEDCKLEGVLSVYLPTIGDIVHYTNLGSVNDDGEMIYPPTQQAAIVTWVDQTSQELDLLVLYRGGGQFPMAAVPYSYEYKRGHWSWKKPVGE